MKPPPAGRVPAAGLGREVGELRAEPLMSLPALLEEFGVEPAPILLHAGIDRSMLEDPDRRLPYASLCRLLVAAAEATDCPHVGLLLGRRAGGAVLGLVSRLATQARTVGEGLRGLVKYFRLHDRTATLTLSPRGSRMVALAYLTYGPDEPGAVHVADGAMAIGVELLRAMCGPSWNPVVVELTRRRPERVDPYRVCFGAPVHFERSSPAIVFESSWLDRPIAGHVSATYFELVRSAAGLAKQIPPTAAELVREALMSMAIGQKPSVEAVARRLGTTRRTLHRRLVSEGATYQGLLQEVRSHLGRSLLANTEMPCDEIAATLNYSEVAAFSRAFKRWTGLSPSQYRASSGKS